MRSVLILLSLSSLTALTACSDGTAQAMADYDTIIADMTTLVADHGATVSAATTLDEVGTAEATYLTDWGTQRDAMTKHMDMMGDCSMDSEDQTMMDDGMTMMDELDTAVSDHVAAHDTHIDISECVADEADHDAMMNENLTTMAGYSTSWADSMECMGGSMAM